MSETEKKPEEVEKKAEDDQDEDYDPEEEVVGNWKLCDLPQIPVVTGEEQEQVIFKARSKLYRWRGQWKERGIGEMKILKHKQTGIYRILVRAEKTHKCIVNHLLQQKAIFCKLQQMKTSNNAWTWAAYDISDEKPETQKFCAKFTSKEDFQKFKEQFQKSCNENEKVLANKTEEKKAQEKIQEKKQQQTPENKTE